MGALSSKLSKRSRSISLPKARTGFFYNSGNDNRKNYNNDNSFTITGSNNRVGSSPATMGRDAEGDEKAKDASSVVVASPEATFLDQMAQAATQSPAIITISPRQSPLPTPVPVPNVVVNSPQDQIQSNDSVTPVIHHQHQRHPELAQATSQQAERPRPPSMQYTTSAGIPNDGEQKYLSVATDAQYAQAYALQQQQQQQRQQGYYPHSQHQSQHHPPQSFSVAQSYDHAQLQEHLRAQQQQAYQLQKQAHQLQLQQQQVVYGQQGRVYPPYGSSLPPSPVKKHLLYDEASPGKGSENGAGDGYMGHPEIMLSPIVSPVLQQVGAVGKVY